jgi:Site-specific recombinases, DNA invertase Pin homologs
MENKKFVPYYRVSKDSHEAGHSKSKQLGLDAQKSIVSFYCKDIVKEFTEVKSAKNITDRPVLQEAIKYCIENNAWLVIAKLDRLSRNVDDVRFIVKALNKKIIFCDIPSDGEIDMMMVTMYAAFAERERELISIRTKQALKVKREREGVWHKNSEKWIRRQEDFVASGDFSKSGAEANKAKAEANENTIRASQLIISKRNEGLSYSAIAKLMDANKFLSPGGFGWFSSTVMRIYKRYTVTVNKIAA